MMGKFNGRDEKPSPPPYSPSKGSSSASKSEKMIMDAWRPFIDLMFTFDRIILSYLTAGVTLIQNQQGDYLRYADSITTEFARKFASTIEEWETEFANNPTRATITKYLSSHEHFDAWSRTFKFQSFHYYQNCATDGQRGTNNTEIRHFNVWMLTHQDLVLRTARSSETDLAIDHLFGPKLQAVDDFIDCMATITGRDGLRWTDTVKKLKEMREKRGHGVSAAQSEDLPDDENEVRVKKSFQLGKLVIGRRSR